MIDIVPATAAAAFPPRPRPLPFVFALALAGVFSFSLSSSSIGFLPFRVDAALGVFLVLASGALISGGGSTSSGSAWAATAGLARGLFWVG